MSQVTKAFTEHPQNSIILMNGAVLERFPKASHQGGLVPNKMKLDTTGAYLSIGNKPCKPQPSATEKKGTTGKVLHGQRFFVSKKKRAHQ